MGKFSTIFNTNLLTRIVTSAILLAILIPSLFTKGLYLNLICIVVIFLSALEWQLMFKRGLIIAVVSAVLSVILAFIPIKFAVYTQIVFILMIIMGILAFISKKDFFWSLFGILYLGIAGFSFLAINHFNSPYLILILFGAVFLSDIFAFFGGKCLAGPKLVPKISPNKTIYGALIGFIASFLFIIIISMVFHSKILFSIFFAILIPIFAQIGDIFISYLKRQVGTKDSGFLLPGHGGILDRIDSLLLVLVFLYVSFATI